MFQNDVQAFAAATTAKFALLAGQNPEDQLKATVGDLLQAVGRELNFTIETVTEVKVAAVGRPDMGVSIKQLLVGYIELKAPGKGADPSTFKIKNQDRTIQ